MRAIIIAAVISLLPAQAIAADQFDLICKGREKTRTWGKWLPIETRYRIDLSAKAWCKGNCQRTFVIQDVNDARITFVSASEPDPAAGSTLHYVDRVDGRWVDAVHNSVVNFDTEGTCEPAPFSGLPANKF